ncbi:MAG: hypothetical protein A2161_17705 [Candidatus Schekmanbacteria bacterium RBG_13_48_7]|uniref:4Fe-4S domain-containing protein n=1 Tax=Candidatus Schekmanbacteria bacterium RBG_13_48_7 TaxID=1817878 RepID=A0A1F7RQM6_9BACT|nr:MAG: hypothetical protein A2161_17705 [Candidatus Schekmanbacteria bacterium RBG_13_48_7]
MEQYRMIAVYPHRITIAKADEIIDAWRVLEMIRRLVNKTWEHRSSIQPLYEMRKKPPALEIFKRLPGTNCGVCGEKTCMAFALRLWHVEVDPFRCKPVFNGEYNHLESALMEICSALGIIIKKS